MKGFYCIDFRLLDVSLELTALEEHLKLIENQIEHSQESKKLELDAAIKKWNLTPDDPEWDMELQNYHYRVEFLIPRILRSPFLVSLYAVYESAVTEIAHSIQKKQGQSLSLNDIRGDDFLGRAKKYYKHILRFELSNNNAAWAQIKILSCLRNVIAHTNGRLEMARGSTRDRIQKWERMGIGVEDREGYIAVSSDFLATSFTLVQGSLVDLVARYKEWDTAYSTE